MKVGFGWEDTTSPRTYQSVERAEATCTGGRPGGHVIGRLCSYGLRPRQGFSWTGRWLAVLSGACLMALFPSLYAQAGRLQPDRFALRPSPLPDSLLYEDEDQDGVVNKYDVCLHQPGPARNDGCPERVYVPEGPYSTGVWGRYLPYADPDADGVPNRWDQCPDERGLRTLAGCPPPAPAPTLPPLPASIAPSLRLSLRYAPRGLLPDQGSSTKLAQQLTLLIRHPSSHLLLLAAPSHPLAMPRLEALKAWLQQQGIAGERVQVLGQVQAYRDRGLAPIEGEAQAAVQLWVVPF